MDQQRPLISRISEFFVQGAVAYCAAAALAGVIGVGFSLALTLGISRQISVEPFDPVTIWRAMSGSERVVLMGGLLLAVWLPVLLGARGVCRITFDLLASRKPSLAKALIDMARFLPAAIFYSLIFGVPMLVASSFLYFPGLLVVSFFTLVIPAGLNEGVNIFQALKRGYSLSGKIYGKLLLATVVSAALVAAAVALRVILLDSLISGPQMRVLAVRMTLVFVPGLLVLILANICFTLLYLEARAKEASSSPQNTATASSGGN
ncbi:MAG TPA: hypothetical protein VGJ51_00305 [Candidatus Angelobacter sp.]